MSTSSPVRTRRTRRPSTPPQAGSDRSPRGESVAVVVRSILLAVAAVSVLATSNYFAYLIGRKQVTYEELRRQVDLVVQLVNQKRAENGLASTTSKQRQDRLEQRASDLTGLTTSTINGKTTVVAPEPAAPGRAIPAALIDDTAVAPPDHEVRLQPPELITECHDKASRYEWRRPSTRFTPAESLPTTAGCGHGGVCRAAGSIGAIGHAGRGRRRSIDRSRGARRCRSAICSVCEHV